MTSVIVKKNILRFLNISYKVFLCNTAIQYWPQLDRKVATILYVGLNLDVLQPLNNHFLRWRLVLVYEQYDKISIISIE